MNEPASEWVTLELSDGVQIAARVYLTEGMTHRDKEYAVLQKVRRVVAKTEAAR